MISRQTRIELMNLDNFADILDIVADLRTRPGGEWLSCAGVALTPGEHIYHDEMRAALGAARPAESTLHTFRELMPEILTDSAFRYHMRQLQTLATAPDPSAVQLTPLPATRLSDELDPALDQKGVGVDL